MLIQILLLTAGLILLIGGAELLVRGASRLAAGMGISPLVIGLTVVAFGTSAPEMAVSARGALAGASAADLALGNVVGSNIFNVLLILGVAALIAPLTVSRDVVRRQVPLMIGISVLVVLLGLDGSIGRSEGLLLLAGIAVYTGYSAYDARRSRPATPYSDLDSATTPAPVRRLRLVAFIGGGLALLVLGSNLLVDSAVSIARVLGVSELVIGLTIVAGGTSLPELATSVLAGLRRQTDIAVGNVVGSNIFNLLAVLGIAGTLSPEGIAISPLALEFDLPVMLLTAIACLPIFISGLAIVRWEGALFMILFLTYTTLRFMAAKGVGPAAAPLTVALAFGLPILLATIFAFAGQNRSDAKL